jgi:hypothetical protein
MRKELTVFVVGSILFVPAFVLMCCGDPFAVTLSVVYLVMLWHSPKVSARIRRFWRKFWRVNIYLVNL